MTFADTAVPGVVIVETDVRRDERGGFATTFSRRVFLDHGIRFDPVETNSSTNTRKATLRGLHYQAAPHAQPKLVRCTKGRVFDVAVDLRPESPTYCRWTSVELSADSYRALYVPGGCAHGFLTLEDDSEVLYLMGTPYEPAAGRGVRWNDPAFEIAWPSRPAVMARRDADYPDFHP